MTETEKEKKPRSQEAVERSHIKSLCSALSNPPKLEHATLGQMETMESCATELLAQVKKFRGAK